LPAEQNQPRSFFAELKRRNVVRVGIAYVILAWLLLQVVETTTEIINSPDWVPQTILLVIGIGFPIAIFFAWAFELTPEGLKREKDVDRSHSITSQTGRKLDFVIIGILISAVAWLGFDKLTTDTTALPEESFAAVMEESASIAVLPFANMSADADSAYFSDGLADTLLHMLAQIKDLRVAARTSSFQFRDQLTDISEIGEQLNVGAVLEGSVQRSGEKIRVTAQLIDVDSGFHLWSGNFDRDLVDVFAIQDEIATEVVAALKLSLLGEFNATPQLHATEDVEAYTQYLLALNDFELDTFESLTSAVNHLQDAIALDPDYAAAYSLLAKTYYDLQRTGAIGRKEGIAETRVAAAHALELSPNSSSALATLAMAELGDGNSEVAGQLLLKAIEHGPNDATALHYYARYLGSQGRAPEGIEVLRQAMRVDPLSVAVHSDLSSVLTRLRRFDEAELVADRLREINPATPYGWLAHGYVQTAKGNWAASVSLWEQAAALDPNDPEIAADIGQQYLSLGLVSEAEQWFDRASEIDASHPVSLAAPLILNWVVDGNDKNNARRARELLNDNIENRQFSKWYVTYMLLDDAQRSGDYTAFLDTLDNLHPNLFDDPPVYAENNRAITHLVGRALVQSGQTERGFHLLRLWSEDIEKFEAIYGPFDGSIEIDLLRGDKDAALAKLRLREQYQYDWQLDQIYFARDTLWQTIADEPLLAERIEHLNQHAAAQRDILQATQKQTALQ